MKKFKWTKLLALCLAVLLIGTAAADTFVYDQNGDDKINVWDLQMAVNEGAGEADQAVILEEILGGGDELQKNENGQWEIWSSVGLYNMAKHAEAGDTFVLMHDVDMNGAPWTPIENFNGTFIGNADYAVSNMKITKSVDGNMGFFASVAEGSKVEYLNLKDMNVIADANATSIGLLAGSCAGTIDGCTVIGFLTDERTTLPTDLKVGGLVGTLADTGEIVARVDNMLNAEGETGDTMPSLSVKLGVRTAEDNAEAYKKLAEEKIVVGHKGNGTVDSMASLEYLAGSMPDPNAIAWVQNGDVTTYPLDLNALLSMVNSDGNTVVTLQADIYNDSAINIPYTSTWDLNGHTVRTNPQKGNCMNFNAIGSDNKITTVKNGTIYHYEMGIRVDYGAVVASNLVMYGTYAPSVGIYDPSSEYNDIHKIEDCELYNYKWGVFSYNAANSDFSSVNITVRRSKLVALNPGGTSLFVKRSDTDTNKTVGGIVTLDYDVEMYTYGNSVISGNGNTLAGVGPIKLEDLEDVTVDGVVHKGMKHWTTNETMLATEVIAEVTNGDKMVQVTNTKDMAAAVSSAGTTQIKLVKDITITAQLQLPYSCTLDLNNYSITNNTGNAVYISGVGSENTVTYIKNGTLNHGTLGVRVDAGSINLSDLNIYGVGKCGASVAFYDPDTNGVYRANNKIDNCYIYNPYNNCIRYNKANIDFSNSGVLVSNSTLIASNSYAFGAPTAKFSGVVELGENLEIYSPKGALASISMFCFAGRIANLSDRTSVTVGDTTITGLKNWSTNIQKETINVLLLGNSLSTTIPEELFQIAKNDGIDLTVTDLYHSGAYGWQHKEWILNDSDEYEYRVYNDMGFWLHGDIESVNDAIAFMDWDHVSYQDFITLGKVPTGTSDDAIALYGEYVDWVHDYLKQEIPNAQHYHYQHWSWQVGHSTIPNTEKQTQLFETIRGATHYFAEQNAVKLIPCGEAWQLARANPLIGDTMCKPDDLLHDYGPTGGQYLNGCVFYEVMFQKTCIGDTWRASNGPSEAIHQALQQHAHDAVAAVHGEDYAK